MHVKPLDWIKGVWRLVFTLGLMGASAFVVIGLLGLFTTGPVHAGVNQWTSNGPEGRPVSIAALAIDPLTPTTVYASISSGGVFKSTDGGASWIAMNTGLPDFAFIHVQALALDPLTPTTVYAGTFSGVFKSTDGGASWIAMSRGLPNFASILALALDPLTPTTVYAGTRSGGVFKSTDGGASWTAMNDGLPDFASVTVLALDPLTPTTVYAGTFEGVFKSTDGGVSWIAMSSGLPVDFAFIQALALDPLTPTTVYAGYVGTFGGVFKSTDGGVSWIAMSSGLPDFVLIQALALDPLTPTTVYASIGSGGVFKSTDGGASWTAMNDGLPDFAFIQPLALDPITPTTVYAGIGEGLVDSNPLPNGGVFKSTDGGASWIAMSSGLPVDFASIQALVLDPVAPTTLYAGTNSDGVFKSTDGGASWTAMNDGLPDFAPIQALALDPLTPTTVYAGIQADLIGSNLQPQPRGRVFKSTDGGASWTVMNDGLPSLHTLAFDPLTPTTVYAGTDSDGVFKSTDGGASWTAMNDGLPDIAPIQALALDPLTPTTVYAGIQADLIGSNLQPQPRGRVFKSTDGGASWTVMNDGLPSLHTLAFDPLTPTTVYAGTDSDGVFKSTDGGASWTAMNDGLPDIAPIQALALDPLTPTTVYAGTRSDGSDGVFKSTDGGVSWIAMSSGLPDFASVTVLAIDLVAPTTVYAGTGANGVFKSTDGGASWTAMNDGLTNPFIQALALDPIAGSPLYAGTGSGVFDFQFFPGVLENPQAGSFQSGIGLISGWVCEATQIEIEFNGTATFEAAYGTSRGDTQDVCDDANNGFSLLFNWNLLDNGVHTVRALADGVEFASVTVTVTTFGVEFLTGASGETTLMDFPLRGADAMIRWQQSLQNFVFVSGNAGGGGGNSGSGPQVLENPQPGSFQGGIGVISGFVCEAFLIEIEFDGNATFEAAYGTSRGDTQEVCGDTNNGFSLLFNWNLLGEGTHTVRALADGLEFASVTITVTTFGVEFLTGVGGEFIISDFPGVGTEVTIRWQQSLQNFVIVNVEEVPSTFPMGANKISDRYRSESTSGP